MGRRLSLESSVVEQMLVIVLAVEAAGCAPPADHTTVAEVVPAGMDDSQVMSDDDDEVDPPVDHTGDDGSSDGYVPPDDPEPPRLDAGGSDGASEADAGSDSDEGWTPVGDDGSPVYPGDAGPIVQTDAGDCRVLAHNTDSGPFNTTGSICFLVEQQPPTAWAAYSIDGRTMTINGVAVSAGQMPFPGTAPFVVVFSAGTHAYASWSYW